MTLFFFPFANCKPVSPLFKSCGETTRPTGGFPAKTFFDCLKPTLFKMQICLNVCGCLVFDGSRIIANKSQQMNWWPLACSDPRLESLTIVHFDIFALDGSGDFTWDLGKLNRLIPPFSSPLSSPSILPSPRLTPAAPRAEKTQTEPACRLTAWFHVLRSE